MEPKTIIEDHTNIVINMISAGAIIPAIFACGIMADKYPAWRLLQFLYVSLIGSLVTFIVRKNFEFEDNMLKLIGFASSQLLMFNIF